MSMPRAPATLPRDFAEALGRAVAGFGFLEEALKHAIHALSRDRLGDTPSESELDAWVTRMEQVQGDSLGTLIESFVASCLRCGAKRDLSEALRTIRDRRNVLCHASWKPVPAEKGGGWRPAFVSSRNIHVPDRMEPADLRRIRAKTLVLARQVIIIARETGYADIVPPAAEPEAIKAELAAAANGSEGNAASEKPDGKNAAKGNPDQKADAESWPKPWHPLDAERDKDASPKKRGQRPAG